MQYFYFTYISNNILYNKYRHTWSCYKIFFIKQTYLQDLIVVFKRSPKTEKNREMYKVIKIWRTFLICCILLNCLCFLIITYQRTRKRINLVRHIYFTSIVIHILTTFFNISLGQCFQGDLTCHSLTWFAFSPIQVFFIMSYGNRRYNIKV